MFIIVLESGKIESNPLHEIVSFVTRFEAIEYAQTAGLKGFVITSTF